MSAPSQKLSLFALTAMVVRSRVGAGNFSRAAHIRRRDRTDRTSSSLACLAAGGIYAERKPNLDAAVYARAKADFGGCPGFLRHCYVESNKLPLSSGGR